MSENSDDEQFIQTTFEEPRRASPTLKDLSRGQERAVREYAAEMGITDLRSFRAEMGARDWDYYDVLKERDT